MPFITQIENVILCSTKSFETDQIREYCRAGMSLYERRLLVRNKFSAIHKDSVGLRFNQNTKNVLNMWWIELILLAIYSLFAVGFDIPTPWYVTGLSVLGSQVSAPLALGLVLWHAFLMRCLGIMFARSEQKLLSWLSSSPWPFLSVAPSGRKQRVLGCTAPSAWVPE